MNRPAWGDDRGWAKLHGGCLLASAPDLDVLEMCGPDAPPLHLALIWSRLSAGALWVSHFVATLRLSAVMSTSAENVNQVYCLRV